MYVDSVPRAAVDALNREASWISTKASGTIAIRVVPHGHPRGARTLSYAIDGPPQRPPPFIWHGAWTAGVYYNRNAAVSYSGYSYICTRAHTSSNANKPSATANTHWDILARPGLDGEDGRGLEHIFAVTASTVTAIPSSQRPLNSWGFDQPGSVGGLTWTDGAPRHHDEQAGALACLAPGGGCTGHRGYGRRALIGPHGGGAWRLG